MFKLQKHAKNSLPVHAAWLLGASVHESAAPFEPAVHVAVRALSEVE